MSSCKSFNEKGALGRGGKIAYSAPCYAQFKRGGRSSVAMVDVTAFEDDPAWLLLPLARREVALRRLEVMCSYEQHEKTGESEAQEAADKLGVTVGQFYRIRRLWLKRRSVFDLLPYGRPGENRQPKLNPEVAEAMTALVRDAVKKGMRTPAILRHLRDNWPLDESMPSHMTVRKKIDEVLDEIRSRPGEIAISDYFPMRAAETAHSYGDIVAIDHAGLQIFVATEGGPIAPIITLVVDLVTSIICGFHLSVGAPGPLQFEAALKDANSRSGAAGTTEQVFVKPRLMFQISGSAGWSKLLSRLQKFQFEAEVIRVQRLHLGEMLHSIGPSIGEVKFSSRRILNDHVFDPRRHALVSFDELKNMLEIGVQDHNERRLVPNTLYPALDLEF